MSINKFTSMTNAFHEPVRIRLGGTPGSGVTEVLVKPGDCADFPENLCKPVDGAGSEPIPSIIARESMRTWPDGARRPTLIPTDDYNKAKAKARAAAGPNGAGAGARQ